MAIKLIQEYNFIYTDKQNDYSIQLGIGDILHYALQLRNNVVSTPIYINIELIIDDILQLQDSYNFLEFRLQLCKKNAFCIMQALCQITPTGKLTDSYDKNEFKK